MVAGQFYGAVHDAPRGWCAAVVLHADWTLLVFVPECVCTDVGEGGEEGVGHNGWVVWALDVALEMFIFWGGESRAGRIGYTGGIFNEWKGNAGLGRICYPHELC